MGSMYSRFRKRKEKKFPQYSSLFCVLVIDSFRFKNSVDSGIYLGVGVRKAMLQWQCGTLDETGDGRPPLLPTKMCRSRDLSWGLKIKLKKSEEE